MQQPVSRHLMAPRAVALLLALLTLLGMTVVNVGAQDAPSDFDPFTVTTNINTLRAQAQRAGTIRVIVGVRADTSGIAGLSGVAYDNAFDAISLAAQNNVLASPSLASASIVVEHQFGVVPYMTLTVDAAALDALAAHPAVISIHNDALARPANVDAPAMNSSLPVIGAPTAWDYGFTGDGFAVAVLDTGVDNDHPALSGAVVSEACYNDIDPQFDTESLCPGGVEASTAPESGEDCTEAVAFGCEHGTHVAGTVASRHGTYTGVAPDADIIAINVFALFPPSICGGDSCVLSFITDQMKGMNRVYALRNQFKIAAINMSLGGQRYFSPAECSTDPRKAIIDKLRQVNIATVIASGNNGYTDSMGAPGCISSAISVGATTDADTVASFSNSASFLKLLAPGVNITSAKAGTTDFQTYNGTSMATPHVAGAWAVLREAKPGASVTQILSVLSNTGKKVTDTRTGAGNRKKPRINLDKALIALAAPGKVATLNRFPINDTAIGLKWTNVTGETEFLVERSPDGTTGWTAVGVADKDKLTFVDYGLSCETTYFYRVYGYKNELPGKPSPVVSAKTKTCLNPSNLLVNGGFEDNDDDKPALPDGWTKTGPMRGDKVVTNGATTVIYDGVNAFEFSGFSGESSRINQVVDLASAALATDDALVFTAFINQRSAKANVVVGQLLITFNNGAAPKKLVLKTPSVKFPDYIRLQTAKYVVKNPATIQKITASLSYAAASGKFTVDEAAVVKISPLALTTGATGGAALRGQ